MKRIILKNQTNDGIVELYTVVVVVVVVVLTLNL